MYITLWATGREGGGVCKTGTGMEMGEFHAYAATLRGSAKLRDGLGRERETWSCGFAMLFCGIEWMRPGNGIVGLP